MKTPYFLAALLLTGCGGGGGGPSAGTADTPPAATPVTMANAFFSSVLGLLDRDADSEPVAVDGESVPAEGLEPQPLN